MTLDGRSPGGLAAGTRGLALTPAAAVSRRSLVAALALAGCASEPDSIPLPPASGPAAPALAVLWEGGSGLVVAGRSLDVAPLRRFYALRRFEPVWAARPAQAAALSDLVLTAARHGLDPDVFHGSALPRRAELPPLEAELLLSSALLSYAGALAHGQVPARRRRPVETLAPEATDVSAALDAALDSADPAGAIEGLAPATADYAALRAELERTAPGPADPPGGAHRQRILQANLERQRWLPRQLPPERVWVNVADQRLTFFRDDRPVLSSRVVVGNPSARDQSPELNAMIEGTFFNPPWVVPRDIVEADILPRLRQDPDYLERRNMVLLENGEVEQRPGPNAGLGYLLFDMPNRFDVFLHDTPAKHFFLRNDRRLSHGCIRVEKPRELAALLMRQPIEAIDEAISTGVTTRRDLPAPVPVFLVYHTAFADEAARVQFRPDFYGRDGRLSQQLRSGGAAGGPGETTA